MTSQALISKIHGSLSANQKRDNEFMYNNLRQLPRSYKSRFAISRPRIIGKELLESLLQIVMILIRLSIKREKSGFREDLMCPSWQIISFENRENVLLVAIVFCRHPELWSHRASAIVSPSCKSHQYQMSYFVGNDFDMRKRCLSRRRVLDRRYCVWH